MLEAVAAGAGLKRLLGAGFVRTGVDPPNREIAGLAAALPKSPPTLDAGVPIAGVPGVPKRLFVSGVDGVSGFEEKLRSFPGVDPAVDVPKLGVVGVRGVVVGVPNPVLVGVLAGLFPKEKPPAGFDALDTGVLVVVVPSKVVTPPQVTISNSIDDLGTRR